ncbi:MAG: chalcone isomerase family protein [Chlamydiia bacterium]|nr:chalcone isomerase family protein [Chlamydiia bacterium]
MRVLFSMLLTMCMLPMAMHAEVVDKSTGASFPSTVNFSSGGTDYALNATGVATRKKFIVKVYSIASYLQSDGKSAGDIMNPSFAKQLTLKWQRDVDGARVKDGYLESMKASMSGEQFAKVKPQVDQFLALFDNGAKEGDEHVYRWIPGGKVEVLINGSQVGTVEGEEFASGLWAIWFGPKSVVNKADLTSMLK